MMPSNLALIPAAGWLKGFSTPRCLVPLGKELLIERLLHQLIEADIPAMVAFGGQGWRPEHETRLLGLKFPPLSITFKPRSEGQRNSRATVSEMLVKTLEEAPRWNLHARSKIYILFVDYLFADSLLFHLLNFPAPCVYSFKKTDASVVLTLEVIEDYLKLSEPYDSTIWCLRHEKRALENLGFCWLKGNELGRRFWELDSLWELKRAISLVEEWSEENQ